MNDKNNLIFTSIKDLAIITIFIVCTFSCGEKSTFNQLKGKGKDISQQISVDEFHSIHVYDDLTLVLINDSVNNHLVEVYGRENLLPNIKVETKNGILSLRNSNRMKWINNYNSGVKVYVSTFRVKEIAMHDAACIATNNPVCCDTLNFKALDASGIANLTVHCDFLHIYSPLGMPDIVLNGSAQSFYCYNADMGFVNASGLQCNYSHIHDFGVNKFMAPRTNQLGVTIENIGDVYYSGNPTILWAEYTNKGRLILLQY